MTDIDQFEQLHRVMKTMTAADLSVLEAGLKLAEVSLTTPPGSPNDLLWRQMEALGWLRGWDDGFDMPNGKTLPLRKYTFTEDGRRPIADLFSKLKGERSRRPAEVNVRMSELHNTFCLEFLRQLRDRVAEGGGDHQDIEILVTNMMVRVVKAGRTPEDAKRAIEGYFGMARNILET